MDNTNKTTVSTGEEPTPVEQFREKVADRIRGDIGSLMPDEMLQQIVKETIEVELNRPVNPGTGYHREQTPWIRKEILSVLKPSIEKVVAAEITRAEKDIEKMVKEEIKELIPGMFANILMTMLKGQSYGLENAVMQFVQNNR